jgi:hypothetical protein
LSIPILSSVNTIHFEPLLAGHVLGCAQRQVKVVCLPKILSGTNAFEISDIQEDETAAGLTRRSESNNVLLKGMSREKCSPLAQCRSFFLGSQPTRLNVHSYFREWSSSAPRSYFVSACEAEKRCSPVVPFLLP